MDGELDRLLLDGAEEALDRLLVLLEPERTVLGGGELARLGAERAVVDLGAEECCAGAEARLGALCAGALALGADWRWAGAVARCTGALERGAAER